MNRYLLGIDLGTSCCKIALFTTDLDLIFSGIQEYKTSYLNIDWVEQDANDWWKVVVNLIKNLLKKTHIKPNSIIGLGIDSQSSVVLPVDTKGNSLRPAMIWLDRRAKQQSNIINKKMADLLLNINGNYSDPSNMSPKILWLKQNEPDIYKKTYKFLNANGYLVYKFTGIFSMDLSQGGLSQLFNTKQGKWSEELIEGCGIDKNKLPEFYNCYDIVGVINKSSSSKTGLKVGTPVIAGSMDMVAAALGAGVFASGQVYVSAGTATAAGVCLDEPKFNPDLHIYHHIIPNRWITAGGVDYGGGGMRWFKNFLGLKDYSKINKLVEGSDPGSKGLIFLPYMIGQRVPLKNNNTVGVILGLNPRVEQKDFIRMFMEGNAFGLRYIFDVILKSGIQIKQLKMTGGCTNIDVWSQIFADVTKRDIEVLHNIDATMLGITIALGYGLGLYNFEDIISKLPKGKMFYPDIKNTELYDSFFDVFYDVYQKLKNNFNSLSVIKNKFNI